MAGLRLACVLNRLLCAKTNEGYRHTSIAAGQGAAIPRINGFSDRLQRRALARAGLSVAATLPEAASVGWAAGVEAKLLPAETLLACPVSTYLSGGRAADIAAIQAIHAAGMGRQLIEKTSRAAAVMVGCDSIRRAACKLELAHLSSRAALPNTRLVRRAADMPRERVADRHAL